MTGQFIPVTSDPDGEGYFAEDRDTVFCKHGRYVGYPGGPDYICPDCEDGNNTVYETDCWHLQLIEKETDKVLWFRTYYNVEELEPAIEVFTDIVEGTNSTGKVRIDVVTDTYTFFGRQDDPDLQGEGYTIVRRLQ